ncbi:hypothetical protein ABBQ38_013768 [Trebouxia sp. C0009 RCD-2024]
MTYTVANIKWNTVIINTTRTVNDDSVGEWLTDFDNIEYSSVDMLMRTTFNQDSVWEDLGVTQQSNRVAVAQDLAAQGWNMTAVVPMQIKIAPEAASILRAMPLPVYTSRQVIIQVSGTHVVPTSLQTQNFITDTLLTLLASDHVFLMRLTMVKEVTLPNNQGSATMTYIMQKSSDTVPIGTALQLVLGQAGTLGSQERSAFTAALATRNISATATVLSDSPLAGDSLQDQIYALTAAPKKPSKHLGAIIGSSVGAGGALLLLTAAFMVFARGWLKKRHLQKQTAVCLKEQHDMADVEAGKAMFHDSGSSLHHHPSATGHLRDEPAAAKCWDIAASDIVICKRPDGSDWLLSSSESGQVFKAVKGGVQDVVVKVLGSSTNLAREDLRKEVEVLKSVSYDRNVVQFYGTCPHGNQSMLVLEYMEGGNLRQALTNNSDGALKWHNKGASIALDIVRGLHFLHSHGVMHMTLKASNVFLTKTYSIAKIGEVDMAQVMGATTLQQPHAATFAYSAPELILHGPCNEKVDLYSFGVILWELITTEVPRRGRLRAIKVPEECPAEIEQLIDLCLATEPADRPTAKQAFDIIGACSLHLPPPVPPTPAPTPLQQDAVPLSYVERKHCSTPPGSDSAEVAHVPEPFIAAQGQKSLNSLSGCGDSVPSSSQQATAVDGSLGDMPVRHQVPVVGHNEPLNGFRQPPSAEVAIANWPEHSGEVQKEPQSPSQQPDGHGAKHSLYSSSEAGTAIATSPTADHSHMAKGPLPLGVFGHLYPSPFAMADDDSGGSSWCWPHGPTAPVVGSDQGSAEAQA